MKSIAARTVWRCALLFAAVSSVQGGSIAESLRDKFSSGETKQDAILELPSVMSTVLSNPFLQIFSGDAKTNMMMTLMQQFTSAAQAPFMQTISSLGMDATPFWVSNDISLKGASLPALQALAAIPGPFTIREPETVAINPVLKSADLIPSLVRMARQTQGQWGVNKIGAPKVWASKTRGEGIIVANIDSGVNGNHEALKGNYAGKWSDPVSRTTFPYDGNGHGTHTMGTICGTKYGIGVAPGAKWIACRGLDSQGAGTEANLKSCGQWILQQKPHVVCNSWGGGKGNPWYNDIVTAWKNAGILPVFSIGNAGPNCGTANSPGDQPVIWSVGSTKEDDTMSSFSSRGRSVSTSNVKPEVSAPGDQIPSSYHTANDAYVYLSGTSMAAPHVTGAAALIRAAQPALTVDQVMKKLESTAVKPPTTSSASCGSASPTGSTYPNYAYGNGRISVSAALGV